MTAILAIDIGGTRLRAGLAATACATEIEPLGDWPAPQNLAGFKDMVGGLLAEHEAGRLGIAIPGLARGTTAAWVPNLPYLDGHDLEDLFPGISIGLGHDAQLALLAEVTAGAAKGMTDAILLAIGTGIGSAVLAGGRIIRGSSGAACSFGWATADIGDPGEDRLGWLERQASGRALDAAAHRFAIEPPTYAVGHPEAVAAVADGFATTPGTQRALIFGAEQILVQHYGLWDLLETRQQARAAAI